MLLQPADTTSIGVRSFQNKKVRVKYRRHSLILFRAISKALTQLRDLPIAFYLKDKTKVLHTPMLLHFERKTLVANHSLKIDT